MQFERDGLVYYSSNIPPDEVEFENTLSDYKKEGREKIRKKAVMDALDRDMLAEADDLNLPAPYGGVPS